MSYYAAKIENNKVVQVIVGDYLWAESNIGGVWAPSDSKVGIGWDFIDGKISAPHVDIDEDLWDPSDIENS